MISIYISKQQLIKIVFEIELKFWYEIEFPGLIFYKIFSISCAHSYVLVTVVFVQTDIIDLPYVRRARCLVTDHASQS